MVAMAYEAEQIAQASGANALRIERPFPVEIIPSELTLPPRA